MKVTDGDAGSVGSPYYGLLDLSAESTIFVAPRGTNNTWPGGADITFVETLLEYLEGELCIDTSRIFAEGFDMGGSMSDSLACSMGDVFRGVAVHSGGSMSGCAAHDTPAAYFMTHGINDGTCTYPAYGVPQLADFARVNGCTDPDPNQDNDSFAAALGTPTDPGGNNPVCTEFTGCMEGYPVRSCIFVGDHTPTPGNGWIPGEVWEFLTRF